MVLYHLLAGEHQNLILMSHFAVEDRKIDAHLKTRSCFKLPSIVIKYNLNCQDVILCPL